MRFSRAVGLKKCDEMLTSGRLLKASGHGSGAGSSNGCHVHAKTAHATMDVSARGLLSCSRQYEVASCVRPNRGGIAGPGRREPCATRMSALGRQQTPVLRAITRPNRSADAPGRPQKVRRFSQGARRTARPAASTLRPIELDAVVAVLRRRCVGGHASHADGHCRWRGQRVQLQRGQLH
jgi:hypothetical protein